MNWSKAVEKTIKSIPHVEYEDNYLDVFHQGVTENVYWQGETVLRAGDPPKAYCVGSVAETVIKALWWLNLEDIIPTKDIRTFIQYTFVTRDEYKKGVAGAIESLGWGRIVNVNEDIQYGDMAQMWMVDKDNNHSNGHSVVLLKKGIVNDHDSFIDWSSSNLEPSGIKEDYHYINKVKNNKHRIWYIGRIDVDMILSKYLSQ